MRRIKKVERLITLFLCLFLIASTAGSAVTVYAADIENQVIDDTGKQEESVDEENLSNEGTENIKENESVWTEESGQINNNGKNEEEEEEKEKEEEKEVEEIEVEEIEEDQDLSKQPENEQSEGEQSEDEQLEDELPEEIEETIILNSSKMSAPKSRILNINDEENTKDDTYVKTVSATIIADGTEPFDDNDEAGNDSGNMNKIVRSFDKLLYGFDVVVDSYTKDNYYDEDVICIKAVMPVTSDKAVFDTSSMSYLTTWDISEVDDRQVLIATYRIESNKEDEHAVPGTYKMQLAVNILAMENGSTFAPEVQFWMENNSTEEKCDKHEKNEVVEADMPEVTISACLKLNVQLSLANERFTSFVRDFDFTERNDKALNQDEGIRYGRSFCYGVTLQLYNTVKGKGLKGMEFPKGPISFQLSFHSSYDTRAGDTVTSDDESLAEYQPLIYSVDQNMSGTTQQDGRNISGFTSNTYAFEAAPGNTMANGGSKDTFCENGGNWTAEANADGTITLTVSDYSIAGKTFPFRNLGSSAYNVTYYDPATITSIEKIDIACFSAGEIWIVQPFEDKSGNEIEEELGSGDFTVTVEASNLKAVSVTNQTCGKQQNSSDDRVVTKASRNTEGGMANRIRYCRNNAKNNFAVVDILGGTDFINNGKDYAVVGQNDGIGIAAGIIYTGNGNESNRIAALNAMVKFDSRALEVTGPIADMQDLYTDGTTFYYGYLPEERNWDNDTELWEAEETDLLWDAAFIEGRNYVAVLAERRSIYATVDSTIYSSFFTGIKVKDDYELAGEVYMTCELSRIWTTGKLAELTGVKEKELTSDDISNCIPSVSNQEAVEITYPEESFIKKPAYEKAEYDESGFAGGHTGTYDCGDSLYILPFTTKIEKSVAQTTVSNGDTVKKDTYNLDKNERIADFKLSPSFYIGEDISSIDDSMETTVTVIDTLPAGMSYIEGSSYLGGNYRQEGEGTQGSIEGGALLDADIKIDEDGITTLTWILTGVKVGEEIPCIYYSCYLGSTENPDDDLNNGDQLKNVVTIASKEEYMVPSSENANNMADEGIGVIKLGSTGFYKAVLTPLVEINQDITYQTIYNNTGNSAVDFIIVDAMPYSGDDGDSDFNGGYEISGWTLDLSKLGSSVDISGFSLYYTDNEQYRGAVYRDGAQGNVPKDTIVSSWTSLPIDPDTGIAEFPGVQPSAWALIGSLAGGKSANITFSVHQDEPSADDILASKASEGNFTRTVKAQRVQRRISGVAWLDENKDGGCDAGESVIDGLKVTLQVTKDEGITWETAKNLFDEECVTATDEDGKYSFENLAAGTYRVLFEDYEDEIVLKNLDITEKEADGISESISSKAKGIKSDNILKQAVTDAISLPSIDVMKSNLYEVEYQNAGFIKIDGTNFTVAAEKHLKGDRTEIAAGEYEFVLTPLTKGAPMPLDENGEEQERVTAVCDEDGNIDFGTILYADNPGSEKVSYQYMIEEVAGDNASVSYDDKPVYVTVTISMENNVLQKEVEYQKGYTEATKAAFQNTYTKPKAAEVVLEATKELSGETLKEGQFAFVMVPVDGAPMPAEEDLSGLTGVSFEKNENGDILSVTVTNDANGMIRFPAIEMEEDSVNFIGDGGLEKYEYQYQITEIRGDDASYAYDGQTVTAVVSVTKNENNELQASVSYSNTREIETDGIAGFLQGLMNKTASQNVFLNTYVAPDSAKLELTGTKKLTGKSIKGEEFSFVLTPQDDAPGEVQIVKNNADGSFTFDALIFDLDEFKNSEDRKTYTYVISEEKGSNPGYRYDEEAVTVQVTLKKTGSGGTSKIEIDNVSYTKAGNPVSEISFENIYTEPKTVSVAVKGSKTLENAELKQDQFRFILTPVGDAPGAEQTVTNRADGSFQFDPIVFEEAENGLDFGDGDESKTFYYLVREKNDGQSNYSYDTSVFTVIIEVKKNADNELEVRNVSYEKDAKKQNEIEFINSYKEDVASSSSEKSENTGGVTETNASQTGEKEVSQDSQDESAMSGNIASLPGTGDSSPIAVFVLLVIVCAGIIAGLVIIGKKRK